jgi:hypothetical protein
MARRKASGSVKVNFKGVESRKTPPEGDYIVEVLEAKSGKSGNGNEQIEFTLEVAKGEYKGVKLWFYCPLQENSLWKLHAFLTALGEEVPEEEMDIDLSELVGKQCVGVLTHETYQGKKRAKMTDFDTLENYSGDKDEDGKKSKKDKKNKKDKDAGKDEKDSKKSKKDKSEKDDKKSGKDDKKAGKDDKKGSKKDKDKKPPKKVKKSDVEDMDEDELESLIDKTGLKVDLDDFKNLKKKRAGVIDALDHEDLLDDDD